MPKTGKCGCAIVVESIVGGTHDEFQFSRNGWGDARERARSLARDYGQALVDISCFPGGMPVYQCNKERGRVHCDIESGHMGTSRPVPSIAGFRRRKRRRSRRRSRR